MSLPATICTIAVGLLASGAQAQEARTIRFETLPHGQVVNQPVEGVSIYVDRGDGEQVQATIFDSRLRNTDRPGLEGPNNTPGAPGAPGASGKWTRGNLSGQTVLGNLLTLQVGQSVTQPDARQQGHTINIEFPRAITSLGFDLINIELPAHGSYIRFIESDTQIATIRFDQFMDAGSVYFDPTVQFAANSANRIHPIAAELLGAVEFDRVEIHLVGRGALDNLVFEVSKSIPAFGLQHNLPGKGFFGSRDTGIVVPAPTASPNVTFENLVILNGVSFNANTNDDVVVLPSGAPNAPDLPPPPPPVVPTPSAVLGGIIMLGGLGAFHWLRRRRR